MILVLDTSTQTPIVALARPDGTLVAERSWHSRHRHGEELLERVDELLREASISKSELSGVVVGTGPGSFTGLRIGLASAKTIAYALKVPIAGVSSTLAMAAAIARGSDATELVVTLPAGASDRYVHKVKVKDGSVSDRQAPKLVADAKVSADDISVEIESAPRAAQDRGQKALDGLGAALAQLGAQRLATGEPDDVALLVPAYVALPRGIAKAAAEMEWSPDLR